MPNLACNISSLNAWIAKIITTILAYICLGHISALTIHYFNQFADRSTPLLTESHFKRKLRPAPVSAR